MIISKSKKEVANLRKRAMIVVILSLLASSLSRFFSENFWVSLISFFLSLVIFFLVIYFRQSLIESARIKKIEDIFPDFLQLMSSNLRAGMTIDRSMLLSSRPEFFPLDKEILKTGRDITAGKNIESALLDMSKRIGSAKINKIVLLIISGIKAGGNIAILLEQTSSSMRERDILEKKAASNVLMYVIFIFLAVSLFAPFLFSLSTILVEILTNIFSGIPSVESSINLPFTLSKINISITFIKYFSIVFMIAIDFLASLILGLVSKGEEKQGLKYFPIILFLSLGVFFISRIFISNFMSGLF